MRSSRNIDFKSDPRAVWRKQGSAAAADGAGLFIAALRVQQVWLYQVENALRPHSLSFARYTLLHILASTPGGATPLGVLSELASVHPASTTKAVDRLEADGLAYREPHPSSGRTTLARITPAGRSLWRKATASLEVIFEAPPLNAEDLESFIQMSNQICSVLRAESESE